MPIANHKHQERENPLLPLNLDRWFNLGMAITNWTTMMIASDPEQSSYALSIQLGFFDQSQT